MKLLKHSALTRIPESESSTHFQGKYFRPAFREGDTSARKKLLAGEMDQAAIKLKYRIQNELPPELEIHFLPETRGEQSLYIYERDGKTQRTDSYYLTDKKGQISNSSWIPRKNGESCEDWLHRAIDEVIRTVSIHQAKAALNPPSSQEELADINKITKIAEEKPVHLEQADERLSLLSFPWIKGHPALNLTLGALSNKPLIQAFQQHSQKIESLLQSDWFLMLNQCSVSKRLVVEVNKPNPFISELYEGVRPTGYGISENCLEQQWVPRYGGVFWFVPLKKLESETAFVERIINHIETLKERAAIVKRFDAELEKVRQETSGNFDMRNRQYLYYQGWEASMKMLATLKEYSVFFHKLDPRLFLEYNATDKDREYIHIEFQEASGHRFSILGSMMEDGYSKSMIYRKRKQTPDQFLMDVFQQAKVLLTERQRLDKLLETVKEKKDFSV